MDRLVGRVAVVNGGPGAWAFEAAATRIADALWIPIEPVPVNAPVSWNYFLAWDDERWKPWPEAAMTHKSFIPIGAILISSDKRALARRFAEAGVATPETNLVDEPAEVARFISAHPEAEWALKWPCGLGATGHRLLQGEPPSLDWPRPYVVQEFVRLDLPEVYRLYAAAGQTFGWNVRRFPPGIAPGPWVAHAQGARYEKCGEPPADAITAARSAFAAVGLLDSFGCADLVRRPRDGAWLVLEVGTDGPLGIVDRDIGIQEIEEEIDRRLAMAFWDRAGHAVNGGRAAASPFAGEPTRYPWAPGPWRRRSEAIR